MFKSHNACFYIVLFLLYRPIDGDAGFGAGLAVAVAFILIIAVVVVILGVLYVKNQFGFRERVQQFNTGIYMFDKNVNSIQNKCFRKHFKFAFKHHYF